MIFRNVFGIVAFTIVYNETEIVLVFLVHFYSIDKNGIVPLMDVGIALVQTSSLVIYTGRRLNRHFKLTDIFIRIVGIDDYIVAENFTRNIIRRKNLGPIGRAVPFKPGARSPQGIRQRFHIGRRQDIFKRQKYALHRSRIATVGIFTEHHNLKAIITHLDEFGNGFRKIKRIVFATLFLIFAEKRIVDIVMSFFNLLVRNRFRSIVDDGIVKPDAQARIIFSAYWVMVTDLIANAVLGCARTAAFNNGIFVDFSVELEFSSVVIVGAGQEEQS